MIKVKDDKFIRKLCYVRPFLLGLIGVVGMLALEDPRNCIDSPEIHLGFGALNVKKRAGQRSLNEAFDGHNSPTQSIGVSVVR